MIAAFAGPRIGGWRESFPKPTAGGGERTRSYSIQLQVCASGMARRRRCPSVGRSVCVTAPLNTLMFRYTKHISLEPPGVPNPQGGCCSACLSFKSLQSGRRRKSRGLSRVPLPRRELLCRTPGLQPMQRSTVENTWPQLWPGKELIRELAIGSQRQGRRAKPGIEGVCAVLSSWVLSTGPPGRVLTPTWNTRHTREMIILSCLRGLPSCPLGVYNAT